MTLTFISRAMLLASAAFVSLSSHAVLLKAVDFNQSNPWILTSHASSEAITTQATWKPVGTIDVVNSSAASGALLLSVDAMNVGTNAATKAWQAALVTGSVKVANQESDLRKLTLAFMLSASSAQPVTIRLESLTAAGQRSGEISGVVYPAAPDFYQRYALDLSTLKATGSGKFNPRDPAVRLTIEIAHTDDGRGWVSGKHEVRLDNVSYATPAYYVSTDGKDTNDGRSERSAFATPQRALDRAVAGDIVVLKEGVYQGGDKPAARFVAAGTPAAWIVLKNYPGQHPVLRSHDWNIVDIRRASPENPSVLPALAYLEVRGLHVRGNADTVEQDYPELLDKPAGRVNTNGIAVDGRYDKEVPHHIRFADNLIEFASGQGVGALEADWITIENNISRYNCRTVIYATSGISTLGASNFDATRGNYKMLIRNNVVHGNETRYKWASVKKYSDGNGIIIDLNFNTPDRPNAEYFGRTLVQGNLSYNNGGSGIHTVSAAHVDIINNTAYLNSASKHLEYSQIFTYGSKDVKILNNILVAPVANLDAGEKPEAVNKVSGNNTDVVFANNLYFGGNVAPTLGSGDQVADPRFVRPSRDPQVADFHLRADSPALGKGASHPALPIADLDGRLRPKTGKAHDLGAYQLMQ